MWRGLTNKRDSSALQILLYKDKWVRCWDATVIERSAYYRDGQRCGQGKIFGRKRKGRICYLTADHIDWMRARGLRAFLRAHVFNFFRSIRLFWLVVFLLVVSSRGTIMHAAARYFGAQPWRVDALTRQFNFLIPASSMTLIPEIELENSTRNSVVRLPLKLTIDWFTVFDMRIFFPIGEIG